MKRPWIPNWFIRPSASLANIFSLTVFGFEFIIWSTLLFNNSGPICLRKSPSVKIPINLFSFITPAQPKPFSDIFIRASDISVPD